MMEAIDDLFCGILLGAIHHAQVHTFVWDGETSRVVGKHPNGMAFAMVVEPGMPLAIDREARVIFEPVNRVRLRPPCFVVDHWQVN